MRMIRGYLSFSNPAAHFASLLLETNVISRFQAALSSPQPLAAAIRAHALAVFRSLPRELTRQFIRGKHLAALTSGLSRPQRGMACLFGIQNNEADGTPMPESQHWVAAARKV